MASSGAPEVIHGREGERLERKKRDREGKKERDEAGGMTCCCCCRRRRAGEELRRGGAGDRGAGEGAAWWWSCWSQARSRWLGIEQGGGGAREAREHGDEGRRGVDQGGLLASGSRRSSWLVREGSRGNQVEWRRGGIDGTRPLGSRVGPYIYSR